MSVRSDRVATRVFDQDPDWASASGIPRQSAGRDFHVHGARIGVEVAVDDNGISAAAHRGELQQGELIEATVIVARELLGQVAGLYTLRMVSRSFGDMTSIRKQAVAGAVHEKDRSSPLPPGVQE
jgi:hypothetical protein